MDTLERKPLVIENDTPTLGIIGNFTFDELKVGDTARLTRTIHHADIELFANVSGDVNPAHLDKEYADGSMFHGRIAHGMLGASLFSTLLGTLMPGPGTIYLGQDLRFLKPVKPGDTITASVTVREKFADKNRIIMDCLCTNQNGKSVITGVAEVLCPTMKVRRNRMQLPDVQLRRHDAYDTLMRSYAGSPAIPTAVVHPCDNDSLQGAIDAARAGYIAPILVGPETKIRGIATAQGFDIANIPIVNAAHSHAAAEAGVALAREGRVQAIMKGSLHTDELMHEVMRSENGLRTARRISHAYVMFIPSYPKPLIVSDAAINITPTLEDKVDIVQNAIDLAQCLGVATPKVAILSAVETPTSKIPGTLDAAVLCKMADRGQIRGGILEGPLAFDNAISAAAAKTKGIASPVAGDPDVLIVPNLEAGNMLAKQLSFLAGADGAGVVLGARLPINLTSRADSVRSRLASCVTAALVARGRSTPGAD
ncbi:MAG TPA: bifunctional enoyl-CoA hydratase/phosphate acetyltransferase [Stellaceae bacterium]|nr:bifunctional enoyl-CoA hydratase/phosphate acetyltransferase [Stellaceae bacterium]